MPAGENDKHRWPRRWRRRRCLHRLLSLDGSRWAGGEGGAGAPSLINGAAVLTDGVPLGPRAPLGAALLTGESFLGVWPRDAIACRCSSAGVVCASWCVCGRVSARWCTCGTDDPCAVWAKKERRMRACVRRAPFGFAYAVSFPRAGGRLKGDGGTQRNSQPTLCGRFPASNRDLPIAPPAQKRGPCMSW